MFKRFVTAVQTFATLTSLYQGHLRYTPDACSALSSYLPAHVVGQDGAVATLVDAVCAHVTVPSTRRPLMVSVHGPPGVGKSLTHELMARALYNTDPAGALECPGKHCPAYKVLYGVDFVSSEAPVQLHMLKDALVAHFKQYPEALVVVEEYDKVDCGTRAMLRQLVQHPELAGVSLGRAIILLESNLGMDAVEELLRQAGDRHRVTAQAAERALRGLMYRVWAAAACEAPEDTLKMTALVDYYLAFLPLERAQVAHLVRHELSEYRSKLKTEKNTHLRWTDSVVDFIADKVEFDGEYTTDGGKTVYPTCVRYVSRHVRQCQKFDPSNVTHMAWLTLQPDKKSQQLHGIYAEQLRQNDTESLP